MGRRSAVTLTTGTVLLLGAVAGFVIVPEHKPAVIGGSQWGGYLLGGTSVGWSHTAYDAARIGTWALLIVGAILIAVGLISYARR
jgi:hypothetical protein